MIPFISFEQGDALCDWLDLCHAIVGGHNFPKGEVGDTFLYRRDDTLLSRAAYVDGMGALVKSATINPANPAQGKPMIHGAVTLFSDVTGAPEALIDFHLVTKWKTAGDSLTAARILARPDSRNILIVGAGTVGRNLRAAYGAGFPDAEFQVWNRTPEAAQKFAASYEKTSAVDDLEAAVRRADIVTSATMSTAPILDGAWFQPGQHIDLIGAYRPDMRETNDAALTRARIFVDSRDTTLDHIGELKIPLAAGVIDRKDICGDFYDLPGGRFSREHESDITLFKNGGGAHLDLMTSRYILDAWSRQCGP